MATQNRIVELVDDTGNEISSSIAKTDQPIEAESDYEKLPIIPEPQEDCESENSMPFEDEDDVPSDFFDDFSNQDFMAGLDVVDAWDDEETGDDKEKVKKADGSREPHYRSRYRNTDRARRRYSRSPYRPNYRGRDYDRRRRSKDKARPSRDKDRRRRSKDKKSKPKEQPKEGKHTEKEIKEEGEIEEAAVDARRDPEKTKRDIQKDKDKCAKNKEAKIISEKLKVVETGLVPPGTEMEVDLKQLKTATKEPEKKPPTPVAREARRRRSRSTSVDIYHSRILYRERHYSPVPRRDTSFGHNRPLCRRSRSPYKGRSRTRSPIRRRLSSERRIFIEERRRMRRLRDSSPTVLRRRSKDHSRDLSLSPNLSEREMWLRHRERQRVRNMSSPVNESDSSHRKRSRDFLEELANKLKADKKKKSFLREIQERLNGPSKPAPNYSVGPAPGPVPSPISGPNPIPGQVHMPSSGFMPTGPPQYFPQQLDPAPQYDQQFFIGHPDVFHNPNQYQPAYLNHVPGPSVVGSIHGELFNTPTPDSVMAPHPVNSQLNSSNYNVDLLKIQQAADIQKEKDKDAITKLFEDKKISLSDFLSMSAKHADPTKPVNVQKKVKVISLCQDAVKALGGDSKLGGRFFLKKTMKEPEKPAEGKLQSPLRRIPVVRFSFTTPYRSGEEKSSLPTTLNKLLACLGLAEPTVPVAPKPAPSPVNSETSVKSAPNRKTPTTPVKTAARKYDPILGAKFQMKMCQTDPIKCQICENRKSRKFVDQSVQCEINTVDSGTQITDEDLQRMGVKIPVKDVLRNQSLAHLTPAQLLGRTAGQDESPKKDIFQAAKMFTPPSPDISAEKQNLRIDLTNNDTFPNRPEYPDRYKPDPFSNQNKPNRPGSYKLPSIFDKIIPSPFNKRPNPFDNSKRPNNSFEGVAPSRPNLFDSRPNTNMHDNRPNTGMHQDGGRFNNNNNNLGFTQRMQDDQDGFEPARGNYGGNPNQRQFKPQNRGKFTPGPYGGRKFF